MLDRDDRLVDAVAVTDGRIVAVGRRDDVMALRGPATELTDLGGRALLPGFIDAHGHLALTAQKLASANLGPPRVRLPPCSNVRG